MQVEIADVSASASLKRQNLYEETADRESAVSSISQRFTASYPKL